MRRLSIIFFIAIIAGCGGAKFALKTDSGKDMVGQGSFYTLTNLHPDAKQKRLYALNYQRGGLIPVCSKVQIVSATSKKMVFMFNGDKYTYINHKVVGKKFAENIKQYFGTNCKKSAMKSMNKKDRKGIANGYVTEGMTRDGVIRAIGYPPSHTTPSLSSSQWKYWKNRFVTMIIHFGDNGRVARVQGG